MYCSRLKGCALTHCIDSLHFISPFAVDEMIAEVDLDGDGRIDFEGIPITKQK